MSSDPLGDRMMVAYGDERLIARTWHRIHPEPNTACWLWSGGRASNGYGVMIHGGRKFQVHRFVFATLVDTIPAKLDLDHLCRVRLCVNPAHLEPVTRKVNLNRGIGLIWMTRASLTHCRHGHPYSGENLGHDGQGRRCRTCDRRNKKAYKARKKAAK